MRKNPARRAPLYRAPINFLNVDTGSFFIKIDCLRASADGSAILEVFAMSYVCHVCGKGSTSGNSVSHSNRKTRRTWKPNLRAVRIAEKGRVLKVKVCTRCLRSAKVRKIV